MDTTSGASLRFTEMKHDWDYERPIRARYIDPLELIWLSCCRELKLYIRRDPDIFSMTDGRGLLALGPRSDLDPDDSLCQMVFHEICHWITNGIETYHQRDWGFEVGAELDHREHACQRLQAALADPHGLRDLMAPTGIFRQYYDQIPADPFQKIPGDDEWEDTVVGMAKDAFERAQKDPFAEALQRSLQATAQIRDLIQPFLSYYQTEEVSDVLPSWWAMNRIWRSNPPSSENDAT